MSLPIFQTTDTTVTLLQSSWASQLNPVLANPASNVSILPNVQLKIGVNVINHLLGSKLQGWYITDITSGAVIYRSAPKDALTLTLTSSAAVTVDLAVF